MGWDRADGMGQDRVRHDGTGQTGWDRTQCDGTGRDGTGQMGGDRQDKPLPSHALGALWGQAGGPGQAAVAEPRSHGRAQLLNPSKAAWIPRGERRDGAGSGAQAGHADGVASGDSRAHARAHGGPGLFRLFSKKQLFPPFLFWQPLLERSPSARVPVPAGERGSGLGNGRFGAEQGHPELATALGTWPPAPTTPCAVTACPWCRVEDTFTADMDPRRHG